MQGCAFNQQPQQPQINTQNLTNQQEKANPKLSHLVGKNYIKGVILHLSYDANTQLWNYEIDGIETTNGKLPYVNFNNKTVLANEGDLVYASFNGMRLEEMFVIKAGYFKNGKITQTTPSRAPKTYTKKKANAKGGEPDLPGVRNKAHQVLSVPQEETIQLN
jgi:hypothetical protein